MELNDVSGIIVDAAMRVHPALGPGLLESAYEGCLAFELRERGLSVLRQLELRVIYRGHRIEVGFRIDLLVENAVVVEIKSVERLIPIHAEPGAMSTALSGHVFPSLG